MFLLLKKGYLSVRYKPNFRVYDSEIHIIYILTKKKYRANLGPPATFYEVRMHRVLQNLLRCICEIFK